MPKSSNIFLYYTFLPFYPSLTYKRQIRDPPSLKILVSAISMPNNITIQYYRRIKNPVELLR